MQNYENCCYSQSIKKNENIESEIKKEYKTACSFIKTETQQETTNKYTFKDYSALVLVTFMVIL